MRDIDLIPADYVAARRTRRSVLVFAVAVAVLLLGTAAACGWIGLRLAAERKALVHTRKLDADAGAQRTRLVTLKATLDNGDAQLDTLRQLRDASVSDGWWAAVDQAFNQRIWLESLVYARALRLAAASPATGAAPAPATAAPAAPAAATAAALALDHTLDLRGHALDHAAVTEFRRALGAQPGVGLVKLIDSGLQQVGTREVVSFAVTAALAPSRPPPPQETTP